MTIIYTSLGNQTVLNAISPNITATSQSVARLGSTLTSAGLSVSSVSTILSTEVNRFISGSSSSFTSSSPDRITEQQLINRNSAINAASDPNNKTAFSQNSTQGGSDYRYPSDDSAPYFMMFNFSDYTRPDPFGTTTFQTNGSVALPIPENGIVDNTNVSWEQQSLGMLGNVYDSAKAAGQIKNGTVSGTGGTPSDAILYGVIKLLSVFNSEAAGLAQSISGAAPNPSLSLLFKGVNFREFEFSWTFAPKSPSESQELRALINYLKSKHLPTFAGSGGSGGTSYLFNYPSIVQPVIVTPNYNTNGAGDSTNFRGLSPSYVTTFKRCALKSVNVNYSPQGGISFYTGTSAPAFIGLHLVLEEIEYLLSADYGGELFSPNSALGGIDKLINSVINTSNTKTSNT